MQDMHFIKRVTPLLAVAMLAGCGDGEGGKASVAVAESKAGEVAAAQVAEKPSVVAASDGSAACLDAPNLRTVGNSWTITTDGQKDVNTVAELTTYRGHSAYRTHTENSVGTVADSYTNVVDGVAHWYGGVMTQPAVNESYNNPSFSFPVELPLNQTHSVDFDYITEQPGAAPFVMKVTHTVTYQGRESIETTFGTFETCKVEFSSAGDMVPKTVWHQWIIASGKFAGLAVRMSNVQGVQTSSAIEVSW